MKVKKTNRTAFNKGQEKNGMDKVMRLRYPLPWRREYCQSENHRGKKEGFGRGKKGFKWIDTDQSCGRRGRRMVIIRWGQRCFGVNGCKNQRILCIAYRCQLWQFNQRVFFHKEVLINGDRLSYKKGPSGMHLNWNHVKIKGWEKKSMTLLNGRMWMRFMRENAERPKKWNLPMAADGLIMSRGQRSGESLMHWVMSEDVIIEMHTDGALAKYGV